MIIIIISSKKVTTQTLLFTSNSDITNDLQWRWRSCQQVKGPTSRKNSRPICSLKVLSFCVLYDAERVLFVIAKFLGIEHLYSPQVVLLSVLFRVISDISLSEHHLLQDIDLVTDDARLGGCPIRWRMSSYDEKQSSAQCVLCNCNKLGWITEMLSITTFVTGAATTNTITEHSSATLLTNWRSYRYDRVEIKQQC